MKLSMTELLVVLLIVVVIFGPTQIPKLSRMLGKSIKNLREGMAEDEDIQEKEQKESTAEK